MRQSLTTRTLVRLWIPTTVLFVVLLAVTYYYGRSEVVRGVETQSGDMVRYYAAKFEGRFRRVETFARMVATYVESRPALDSAGLTAYMRAVVLADPGVYGSCVAFEPGAFMPGRRLYAPYYCSRGGEAQFVQLGTDEYDYPEWEWYSVPRRTGRPGWSEPYYDTGGGEALMITYSAPFFRDGRFRGVATADVSLAELNSEVRRIRVAKTGYAFLVSRSGRFISYPDSSKVMTARLSDLSPELAGEMVSGGTRFARTADPLTGRAAWVIYSPVPAANMFLAIVFPVREVMARVLRFESSTLVLSAVGLLALLVVVVLVASSVARPITELAAAVRRVGRGELAFHAPAKVSRDEVGELTSAFGTMVKDLNRYVGELERTTAERERIARELDIAREIQQAILPRPPAPGPGACRFDVAGRCVPARQVGGDFYDFFLLDTSRLGFLIADVSDKGIPAALFMAMTRTLFKSVAQRGVQPGECLSRVNRLLFDDNRAMMFVSAFYAVLDSDTGELSFANAGHPPPYLVANGRVVPLAGPGGVVLGVTPSADYATGKTELAPGSWLFLYTDGVTEAMDPGRGLYGAARLEQALAQAPTDARDLLDRVLRDVNEFAAGAEPADDVTALALAVRAERWVRFTVAARRSETSRLHREVAAFGAGLAAETVHACTLALEEVVTNVIRHGYDDGQEHPIEVTLSADFSGAVRLVVRDQGKPFNPLDAPVPDTSAPLDRRPAGGLGIHLVRHVMDEIRYERSGDCNVLTMTKQARRTQEDCNGSDEA